MPVCPVLREMASNVGGPAAIPGVGKFLCVFLCPIPPQNTGDPLVPGRIYEDVEGLLLSLKDTLAATADNDAVPLPGRLPNDTVRYAGNAVRIRLRFRGSRHAFEAPMPERLPKAVEPRVGGLIEVFA